MKKQSENNSFFEKLFKLFPIITIFLIPILYYPWHGPISTITSKLYFFIGSVDILVVAWVWLLVSNSRYRLSRKNLLVFLPALVFLGIHTVAGFLGISPVLSFFSTFESGLSIIMLWHVFAFSLVCASVYKAEGERFIRGFAKAVLASSVILAVLTALTDHAFDIGSKFLNSSMGGATMGNILLVGAYFIFTVFLAIWLIATESRKSAKIWYGIGVAVVILSPVFFLYPDIWMGREPISAVFRSPLFILGHARMAQISLAIGAAFAWALWLGLSAKCSQVRHLGKIGAGAVIVILLILVAETLRPTGRIHDLFIREAGERPVYWQEAIKGIKERPVLGWGNDAYPVVYYKHLDTKVFEEKNSNDVWVVHPHNAWLEIAVGSGMLGLVAYVSVFIAILAQAIILYRRGTITSGELAGLAGILLAYNLQNQMIFDSLVSHVMVFSLISWLAVKADLRQAEQETKSLLFENRRFLVAAAAAVMIPAWIFFAYLPSRKAAEVYAITNDPSIHRVEKYEHLFHSARSYSFKTDPEYYVLTFTQNYDGLRAQFVSNQEYRAIARQEVDELMRQVDSIWDDTRHNYKFAFAALRLKNLQMFLNQQATPDDVAQAQKYADRAIALSPTNPMTYWALTETYFDTGDYDTARHYAAKAVEIDPSVKLSWVVKMNFEKTIGDTDAYRATKKAAAIQFPGEDIETEPASVNAYGKKELQ